MRKCSAVPYFNDSENIEHYLLCFPHAGGTAGSFSAWTNRFPPGIGICAVQYPGREGRQAEKLITDFDELISYLYNELSPLLDKPFSLFGHSLGGLIAYEFAKKFSLNKSLTKLFISATSSPWCVNNDNDWNDLSDAEFVRFLKRYGGLDKKILNSKLMLEYLLPRIRADFDLFSSYVKSNVALSLPITVFYGKKDNIVSLDTVKDWARYCSLDKDSAFNLVPIDGDHFFYLSQFDSIITETKKQLINEYI